LESVAHIIVNVKHKVHYMGQRYSVLFRWSRKECVTETIGLRFAVLSLCTRAVSSYK